MKRLLSSLAAAAALLAAGSAVAQPGAGAGHGPRWNGDNTPGWSLMTREERDQHHQRMTELKSREECQAYIAQHHEQMSARAKEQGRRAIGQPRRDPCAHFKR